jgi:hydroxymethylbilane synthase
MHFRIATRSSLLALWQAEYISERLSKFGHTSELVKFDTKGDKVLDVTLSKIGSKGVFTEELEESLRNGETDIAVHSAKDLPSQLGNGLEIVAFSERELVDDVLISFDKIKRITDENIVVGTSSTRRVAILRHYYPNVKTVDMRGNLQTRMRKLQEGQCDAIILAYAGVHRMGYDDFIVQKLPLDVFIPPVGQGCVAIEIASSISLEAKTALRLALNDEQTETCLLAERSYLQTLQGGCSIPSFAHAVWADGKHIFLKAGIISLDGSELVQDMLTVPANEAEKAGNILAKKVLRLGGDKILEEIRREIR